MRIEQAWQKRGLLAIGLWPLSILYQLVSALRRILYTKGVKPIVDFPELPVVVVGNVTVGGTGKSPLVAHLVRLCQQRGGTPGIVSRGYGVKPHAKPILVRANDTARIVGDEPMMLFELTGVPVCVCRDRVDAVRYLAANTDVDTVISDDGLQHLAMGRRVEIIVIDAMRRFGNGWFLPAGPLRESKSRLETVDLVVEQVVAENDMDSDQAVFRLQPSAVTPLMGGDKRELRSFAGSTVHAIAGVGNPRRFFDSLCSNSITVIEHPMADHHDFVEEDLRFGDDLAILVTYKDAVKIRQLPSLPSDIHVVDVRLEPNDKLTEALDKIVDDIAAGPRKPVSVRTPS